MQRENIAIVGGGISGLVAAHKMVERGIDPSQITIYEAQERLGGKIETAAMDGTPINMGAEFLSKDDTGIVNIAHELGVKLSDTTDQAVEVFQGPDGKMIPNFHVQYAPIAAHIMELREEAEKNPELAQQLQGVSAKELLTEIGNNIKLGDEPSAFERVVLRKKQGRVPQDVIDAALKAMEHEQGVPADQLTAAQFIAETSPSTERFLASTLDHRVEGGTEELIKAMQKDLEAKGVHIETGKKLVAIQAEGNTKNLSFSDNNGTEEVKASKAIIATPAYALANVQGLEGLGLNEHPVGYTRNAKFTVKLKTDDFPTKDQNAFLNGAQVWSAEKGTLTFLVHNEDGRPPKDVMQDAMENYAKAFGKPVDELFDITADKPTPGSFVYTNPGDSPCWSTPSPEHAQASKAMFARMQAMEQNGVGFVGSYIPMDDGGVGFMEAGAQSAERTISRLFDGTEKSHAMDRDAPNLAATAPGTPSRMNPQGRS